MTDPEPATITRPAVIDPETRAALEALQHEIRHGEAAIEARATLLADLRKQGYTLAQLADVLGTSREAIRKATVRLMTA